MIKIQKENLLKDTIDYEEYSENICNLSVDELIKEGILKCGGCCAGKKGENSNCSNCTKKINCKNN